MKINKLRQIQRAFETFFYKVRFNIALYGALHSSEYYKFRGRIQSAIQKQILYFAKVEKIDSIVGFQKAVRDLTEKVLLFKLKKLWIPLLTFITTKELASYIKWAANKGGQAGLNKLKTEDRFEIKDKKLLKKMDRRAGEVLKLVDITTQDWIARTIEEGLKNKLSHYEIAKLLRDAAKNVATERAELIAENEAALMLGELETEVYKRNGVKLKYLITARDERVCPICVADEEAGRIPIDDPFPSGYLFVPVHKRCRCFVMPVIPEVLEIIWTG